MFLMITLVVFLGSFLLGSFVFRKPASAIEFQRRFYEKINWRIEPISMEKELKHTRLMGFTLIIFCLAMSIFYFGMRF